MPSIPLQPDDLLVEFRDKNLVRRGAITAPDLNLKVQPVFNGVGSWSITLPAEHRAVPYLRQPGAGIIVTNLVTGDIVISGSTSKPTKRSTASEPSGMATLAGLSDDRLLWDALAFPEPANANVATQAVSHDVRTGPGETIMREYVAHNIATSAAPERLGGLRSLLRLQADDKGLGSVVTKRARFANLGDLLNAIAIESGGLGFRIVQRGEHLEFEVYQPVDRSAYIRLDVANGTLDEQSVEFAPPEVTRVVVAGQGEGADRQIIGVTTPEAAEAEAEWGMIIEEFKDQRQTDVESELTSAGLGELASRGFTKVAVKATPANDQTMVFMQDFGLGDRVSVIIDGQEPKSYITEAALVVNANGIATAVAIGDIADFDRDSALRQTVTDNTKRIEHLERNAEGGEEIDTDQFAPKVHKHPLSDITVVNLLSTDLDTIDPGYYDTGSTNNGTLANHFPVANVAGFLEDLAGPSHRIQRLTERAPGTRTWVRTKFNANPWSAWSELARPGQNGAPYRMATGSVASPGGGSNSGGVYWDASRTVTLPVGLFTQTPTIQTTAYNNTGQVLYAPQVIIATKDSFTVRQMRVSGAPDSSSVAIWTAIQMTP